MKPKKYKVYLTKEEREELIDIVKRGTHSAQKIRRANILLLLDENQATVKTQKEIAQICQSTTFTVSEMSIKFSKIRMEAINRKKREQPPRPAIVTGEVEAHIIAINCSEPPEGRNKWTLKMTAERLIELEIVPSISKDTVAKTLKKRTKTAP